MIIRRKRFVVLAVFLAALFVLISPVPGGAQNIPSDVIIFCGDATITASIPGPPTAVYWIGGTGSYSFTQGDCPRPPAIPVLPGCFGMSTPDMIFSDSILRTCTIATHAGTFVNTVCGTGTAAGGPVTITEIVVAHPPPVTESLSVTYSIIFVASVGVITGTVTEGVATGDIAGVVRISASPLIQPTPPIPPGGPCATAFTVTGAAVTFQGVA